MLGGSTLSNLAHGVMMGYLKTSTSIMSYLSGLVLVCCIPQQLIDKSYNSSVVQWFFFLVDCLLRVHCVTSWGVDNAIRANGSVISATFASIATGCGGGFVASVLLDKSRGSTMDKISRVFALKKREIEHLLTMSLFYQVLIGFLPLPMVTPLVPFIPMGRVHDNKPDKP
ncbi:hypothetical protein BLSTO_02867 [Blastocystis sp. subtype 1]